LRLAESAPVGPTVERMSARTYLLLTWCLCFVIAVASGYIPQGFSQDTASSNPSNVVRGTVVNDVTQQPIGRALVRSPDSRYATMTDGEGHFEFTLPKGAGSNIPSLMATKPGFLDDQTSTQGADVTIDLTPEALIKGRISVSNAESVRGVNVQLMMRHVQEGSPRWMMANSVMTNSSGEFRFAELQPGTYKVFTHERMDTDPEDTAPGGQAYGYPPVYYPSAAELAGASTIQLAAGQIVETDMTLVRQAYYPVKIPVIGAEATNGVNVTVSPQGQRGPGFSLGYIHGTHFIEGQLPNGKYLVEATSYAADSSANGSVNLVVAGGQAEGPAMAMARNNSITVNVKEEFTVPDQSGSGPRIYVGNNFQRHGPGSNLQVRAESMEEFGMQRGGQLRPLKDANDESLVLENLVPGRYWLRLTANRGYVASATMGGVDLLREPLVVVPGASGTIDVTLRDDVAELHGTLVGVSQAQVESVNWSSTKYVYCIPLPDSSGDFVELAAGSDGKFDYDRITPGVYRVIAFSRPQPDLAYRDPEAMKAYESKGQIVHFAPEQKVTLQLQIVSGSE
jgi:hypothetical protein